MQLFHLPSSLLVLSSKLLVLPSSFFPLINLIIRQNSLFLLILAFYQSYYSPKLTFFAYFGVLSNYFFIFAGANHH